MSMAYVADMTPKSEHKARSMSLEEFMKTAGSEEVKNLTARITGGTYSGCHTAFFEATGIWIPELVPVFQKLDAMMVIRGPIKPHVA